ncbi:MAG: hypothetical protein U1D31_00550 [Patescibacteria group bacterium]|nr:hypothetical protein [bacterium]MDZ4240611.1 hypothetical protein [Patescibacteria group bacterium]
MKKYAIPFLAVAVIGAGLFFLITTPDKPGELDAFTACLKDKEAIFYGAFWCPNCANQKAMFGRSMKKLPYIECSTPDGNSQLQACKDKGITAYPTWDFADGERVTGTIPLDYLSEKTGCELPIPTQ